MKYLSLFAYLGCAILFCSQATGYHAIPQKSNSFVIDGMHVEWNYNEELLTFQLKSPYQGWLALGFNDKNDIVETNLIQGAVKADGVALSEQFVVGFGNPQPIETLGGQTVVTNYIGLEDNTGTAFEFTVDTSIKDDFHYDLKAGNKVWLICAYSMEDDFGHHSIMRRHIEVEL